MNNRLTGILIIIVSLMILSGIIYVIFFYDFAESEVAVSENRTEEVIEIADSDQEQVNLPVLNNAVSEDTSKAAVDFNGENLKKVAISFAERFGSYSNHSNYDNINDLKIFMSSQMRSWAENYVKEAREKESYSGIYYGITTKATKAEVKNFNEEAGIAEITVYTQRKEGTGTMSNASVFSQNILISFVRERGVWKVDEAYWGE